MRIANTPEFNPDNTVVNSLRTLAITVERLRTEMRQRLQEVETAVQEIRRD